MAAARLGSRLRLVAFALFLATEGEAATFVYSSAPCREGRAVAQELSCHTPIFAIDEGEKSYNKIGQPHARVACGLTRVTVDPERPVVFVGERADELGARRVVHLLYRVHFTRLAFHPRVFFEMHRHPGLLAIVTLDAATREPLMLTTAQTCGCYRSIVPTDRFPAEALPVDWPSGEQEVWGKTLPASAPAPNPGSTRFLIRMEPRTHRVIDVQTVSRLPEGERQPLEIASMSRLHELPIAGREGETTSFFYERGPFKGYVKRSWSPIEGLTLGLLILDPLIGSDKDFGDPDVTGTRFYTMLLPWNREVSRLDRFEPLLRKLGFRLERL